MNAICLVLDRLHAGYLGAYGNSWINTPQIDRLASRSIVFDQALIDSPRLERLCRSYWHGWHAMCPDEPPPQRPTLPAVLRDAGVRTALLTDEKAVAEHLLAADFDELLEFDPPWQPLCAGEIEQTHLAQSFARVISWLESAEEPFLLWCHLAGMGTTWDAPLQLRRSYREQGDPPPPEWADVPDVILGQDYDPDELLGITQAYAGQVSLMDICLGALMEFLEDHPVGNETLLALTSPRGFPLGEHGRVGACGDALYGELVHVPLMLRMPDGSGAALRNRMLVEPADLWATLLEYWGVADVPPGPTALSLMPLVRDEALAPRDRLCIAGGGTDRAIRTPAWYLRVGAHPELFAKPDDRWEANDVADRCHEVVDCLQDAMAQHERALRSGRVEELPPLGAVLRDGLE